MNCCLPFGSNTHTHTYTHTCNDMHTDVYCCRRIPIAVTTTLLRINSLSLLHNLIGWLTFSLQYITYSCTLFTPAHAKHTAGFILHCLAVPGSSDTVEGARDNAWRQYTQKTEILSSIKFILSTGFTKLYEVS